MPGRERAPPPRLGSLHVHPALRSARATSGISTNAQHWGLALSSQGTPFVPGLYQPHSYKWGHWDPPGGALLTPFPAPPLLPGLVSAQCCSTQSWPPHTSFQDVVFTAIQKYKILNHLRFFVQNLLFKIIFIHALTYQPYLIHNLVKSGWRWNGYNRTTSRQPAQCFSD